MPIITTFVLVKCLINIKNCMKYTNFNDYRCWFNRMFSLSLDGKFKGLSTLAKVVDVERFAYRLYKILNGYYRKPSSDVICIRLSGHVIKLYNR